MKKPTIIFKKTLEVTLNDTLIRLNKLEGIDKKALREEYKEWINELEDSNTQPHVLYANQLTN